MPLQGLDPSAFEKRVKEIVDSHLSLEGPLLPILHSIQSEFNHIPKLAIPVIAATLNLSRAEVHGVVSFYHDFHEEPVGRHVIKICRAEACQSMGGDELAERLLNALGLEWSQTSEDGAVVVEAVYCLGLCACAPAAMVNGSVIGRLDAGQLAKVVREVHR